jgi:hypothetical protein
MGPKHVVLIAKANVNEEINSCIIDGKLDRKKVEYSNATGCLNTRLHYEFLLHGSSYKSVILNKLL